MTSLFRSSLPTNHITSRQNESASQVHSLLCVCVSVVVFFKNKKEKEQTNKSTNSPPHYQCSCLHDPRGMTKLFVVKLVHVVWVPVCLQCRPYAF